MYQLLIKYRHNMSLAFSIFITLFVNLFEMNRGNDDATSRATKEGHSAVITFETNQVLKRKTVINERLARNTWCVEKTTVIPRESESGPKTSRVAGISSVNMSREALIQDFQLLTYFSKSSTLFIRYWLMKRRYRVR